MWDYNCVIEYNKKLNVVLIKENDDLVGTQPLYEVKTKSQLMFNLESVELIRD